MSDNHHNLKLATSGSAMLPAVQPQEALEMTVDSALRLIDGVHLSDFHDGQSESQKAGALRTAIAKIEALDLQALQDRLDAIMQPATIKQIGVALARLVAGYPTKNRDPMFANVLFDEISSVQPSFGEMDLAIRRLLRTEKFLPSIAEVLEALSDAERDLNEKRRKLAKAPGRIEATRARLKCLERTPEEIERDAQTERERKIEECVELLIWGGWDSDEWLKRRARGEIALIVEARRRILEKPEGDRPEEWQLPSDEELGLRRVRRA
jgi:hypothetical protein